MDNEAGWVWREPTLPVGKTGDTYRWKVGVRPRVTIVRPIGKYQLTLLSVRKTSEDQQHQRSL